MTSMSEVETISKGEDSRVVEARRFIIRDRQAFAAIWAAHAGPASTPPTVDFNNRMVAAVFAGERPTPGYSIEVAGTQRQDDALAVLIVERQPDPATMVAQVLVAPFHIASLPRDDGKIRFSEGDPSVVPATIVFKPTKKPLPQAAPQEANPETKQEGKARSKRPVDWGIDGQSSTGLTPRMAAALAYLAGPFSGVLVLSTERTSRFVRFHAWQAIFGLGVLGTVALAFLTLAFVTLIASPTAFWVMLWLAAITGVGWVIVWMLCLRQAYIGRMWKLPFAGIYAERFAKTFGPTTPRAGEAR